MKWIIEYIKQCFCKHEFVYEEIIYDECQGIFKTYFKIPKVSRTCKKCGWHKSYWKY